VQERQLHESTQMLARTERRGLVIEQLTLFHEVLQVLTAHVVLTADELSRLSEMISVISERERMRVGATPLPRIGTIELLPTDHLASNFMMLERCFDFSREDTR
jgi:hypothetical protein